MASKPRYADIVEHDPVTLPDWQVLEVAGTDALAFLQRQTMNDVAALGDEGRHWNGLLSAKGRVLAIFVVLRRDAQCAWLLVPDQPADALAGLLRPFVLRSRLALTPRPDLVVIGSRHGVEPAGGLAAGRPDGDPRRLSALPGSAVEQFAADDGRWRFEDLWAGVPRLEAAQRDAWTPHMLSLERLSAFSLKKGCYPGQEVVARTHYLGRAKRGLWRLVADSTLPAGAALSDPAGAELGRVVGSADWRGAHVALAVAPLDGDPAGWRVGEVPVNAERLERAATAGQ